MTRNTFGRSVLRTALLAGALLAMAAPAAADADPEGRPSCNPADLAPEFGVLDLYDVVMFVHCFQVQAQPADLDQNGIFDLADIAMFVDAFNAGCSS